MIFWRVDQWFLYLGHGRSTAAYSHQNFEGDFIHYGSTPALAQAAIQASLIPPYFTQLTRPLFAPLT